MCTHRSSFYPIKEKKTQARTCENESWSRELMVEKFERREEIDEYEYKKN